MELKQPDQFVLPVSIVSPTDVARLTREIESIDNFFRESEIRQGGESNAMPRLSKLMDQFITNNELNLLQETDRSTVLKTLTILHNSAPVIHMSFSVDPPGPYVQKIVGWIRSNIHPQVLITVGLQPNIGAGCVMRTTNKLFDLSLREFFAEKREFFIEKLHKAISDPNPIPAILKDENSDDTVQQAVLNDEAIQVKQFNQIQTTPNNAVLAPQPIQEAPGKVATSPQPIPQSIPVQDAMSTPNQSEEVS